jgi:hypothetical protein
VGKKEEKQTHHRMSDSKDWNLWMLFSHQLDVIEDVIDVVVNRLDVDAVPIAHSVSNCVDSQQKNREESHISITRRQKSRLCPA